MATQGAVQMQASPLYSVWTPIESLFAALGLGTPVSRGLFGVGLGALVAFGIKPSGSFNADGTPKTFSPLLPASEKSKGTLFPWYFYPLLFGLLFGLFV